METNEIKEEQKAIEAVTPTAEEDTANAQKQDAGAQSFDKNKVLVFATLDEAVQSEIEKLADAKGLILVRLEPRVIDDFADAQKAPTPEQSEVGAVERFVNNEANRSKAVADAKKLFTCLTKKGFEKAGGMRFTRKDVVKHTTLSHKAAAAELALLETFGLIQFTGGKIDEFEFHFDSVVIQGTIRREILALIAETAKDVVRYKATLKVDPNLTDEQRTQEVEDLRKKMDEIFT